MSTAGYSRRSYDTYRQNRATPCGLGLPDWKCVSGSTSSELPGLVRNLLPTTRFRFRSGTMMYRLTTGWVGLVLCAVLTGARAAEWEAQVAQLEAAAAQGDAQAQTRL